MGDIQTHKIEKIEQLFDDSLLITGSGNNKSKIVSIIIKELLNKNKRICLIDFRNIHNNLCQEEMIVSDLKSIDYQKLREINSIKISFDKNILYFRERIYFNDLLSIIRNFEYLIIDDVHFLFSYTDLKIEELLNHPNLKVIMSIHTLALNELEIENFLTLRNIENQLLLKDYTNSLIYLEPREALFISKNKVVNRFFI